MKCFYGAVDQINFSDITGGASRAAYRIHHALRSDGVDSKMHVAKATVGDWTVSSPTGKIFRLGTLARPHIVLLLRNLLRTVDHAPLSLSVLPSGWPQRINKSDADVAHLHWVCGEMMSVEDIGHIRKPIVWTLHDMWAFCGAEHYSTNERWREGYRASNRPKCEGGFDLNRWVWGRKHAKWKKPFQIVTPSRWLAGCVKKSALMHDWPVTIIPNAIDTDLWQPIDRSTARMLMGLPQDAQLIAFGSLESVRAHHKGFDLLLSALTHLRGHSSGVEVVIFGQGRPSNIPDLGFRIHYTGHLHDDLSLRVLYSAVDTVVIPSRMDNLPNVGVESLACGTPVVAFDTCGLPDIVTHKQTGWLAKPFDAEDLATGIRWILQDEARLMRLRHASRAYALEHFSFPIVAAQYEALYQRVLEHN